MTDGDSNIIDKSKCMIIGKSPFTCEPVWRLNDVSLRNVETIEILGNVFNSKGNNTSHVDNRLNKCRQSFYSLNSLGMSYPGAAPEVQAHVYKSICQPVFTYGMECMSNSKDQFRRMESIQGRKGALYRIWCGVNRLDDSGVNRIGDTSAFVIPAGQPAG